MSETESIIRQQDRATFLERELAKYAWRFTKGERDEIKAAILADETVSNASVVFFLSLLTK